jgi:hypothetical protein
MIRKLLALAILTALCLVLAACRLVCQIQYRMWHDISNSGAS